VVEYVSAMKGVRDDECVSRFLLAACDTLSSYDFFDQTRQTVLMHRYANRALPDTANPPLEVELGLLAHLQHDFQGDEDRPWPETRRARAARILRLLQQLEESAATEITPEDIPMLGVAPPAGTGLPTGTAPKHVGDPELRRLYADELRANELKAERLRHMRALRNLYERYASCLESHLIAAYVHEPHDPDELKALVAKHLSTAELRNRILTRFSRRAG
jgi:hypothetical protein